MKKVIIVLLLLFMSTFISIRGDIVQTDDNGFEYYNELFFTDIDSYNESVIAIANDGDLYTWGQNEKGELGTGDLEDRASPVNITASLNLAYDEEVVLIEAGYFS